MGVSESKLLSKKTEKRIVKCPIVTTEIIASDCESIRNVISIVRPTDVFSLSNLNTLSSMPSIETLSNISLLKSEWCLDESLNPLCPAKSPKTSGKIVTEYGDNGNDDKTIIDHNNTSDCGGSEKKLNGVTVKPKIQKLNSKIELLDESLSDQHLTSDEFTTSESANSNESNESSYNSSSQESGSNDSVNSSESSNPEFQSNGDQNQSEQYSFNKGFLQNFKNRYNTNCEPCKQNTGSDYIVSTTSKENLDSDDISSRNNGEFDDSFTEITKVVPTNNHSRHKYNQLKNLHKSDEVKYLQSFVLKKLNDNLSKQSVTTSSSRDSGILVVKQHSSVPNSKTDISNDFPSKLKRTSHSAMDNDELNSGQLGFRCICYKFWVDATFDTWKVFHNPRDRRIESIGRLSNCQIRLTKITQRSSKGMLKRQVFVYASTLSALEKCCKLFNDKFPHFCATAGLTINGAIDNRS